MKEPLHANAKKAEKQIHKLKAPSKRKQQESNVTAEDMLMEPSDESEEDAESVTMPPPRKPHKAHSTPPRTKGCNVSLCF